MPHLSPRRVLPPLAVVVVAAAALIYLATLSGARRGPLQASGTIESTQVGVASEVSGRVAEVLVQEGQPVVAGDVLLRLDDRLPQAQRRNALAAGQAAVAAARMEQIAARQALDDLHTHAPLALAQAQQALANARDALDDAQRDLSLNQPGNRATSDTLKGAKAKVAVARERMEQAQTAYDHMPGHLADGGAKAEAYLAYINARNAYNTALSGYNWLNGHATDIEQSQHEADVAADQAQVDDAQRRVNDLRNGPDPDALELAQARLSLADAQLAAAQAKADVDLATLDLQLEKLNLRAPADGVILTRSIEPGEVLVAGAPALALGELDHLTITVYLPEDRYGEVSLGDEATVTVDAFPDETFRANVVHIADQAEFTPRNVQTDEGRRTTVYAVELDVADPQGLLKPGMPADVLFAASR
ncbi:MAG TPA: HlyD family efflux transporter periplasmic adaptor subunit [Anaerolineales bacterium]|nr:HlyD family efflux transporter periplasmic adaptor subunit [Anaerolineales bacterium]